MSKVCNQCDKENNLDNSFCIYCGAKFIQEAKKNRFCNKCGTEVSKESNFCTQCGVGFSTKKEDNHKEKIDKNHPIYKQVRGDFDGLMISLLVKIAKADGRISEIKAKVIELSFDNLSKSRPNIPNIRDIYKAILENEKSNLANIAEICRGLISSGIDDSTKKSLIHSFLSLSYADGSLHRNSENLIVKIVSLLYLDYSYYLELKSEFEPKQQNDNNHTYNGANLSLNECYEILKINENSNNQIIKSSYRKLVRDYHSDILSSKDLPKDMIEYAEEKLKKINRAYETIKKYRGMK